MVPVVQLVLVVEQLVQPAEQQMLVMGPLVQPAGQWMLVVEQLVRPSEQLVLVVGPLSCARMVRRHYQFVGVCMRIENPAGLD